MNLIIFLGIGFAVGAIAWGNSLLLTAFSLLLWVGYFVINKRVALWLFALGYYLGASRGLFYGTATYYDDYLYAATIYFGAALITSFAWVLLWSNESKKKMLYFMIVQVILLASPVALISWANPLQVAGLFFPSMGFIGLVLLIATTLGFYLLFVKQIDNAKILPAVFVLVALTNQKPIEAKHIQGVTSHFTYDNQTNAMLDYKRQVGFVKIANEGIKDVLLLSENALGVVTQANKMIWSGLNPNKSVYAGGNLLFTPTAKPVNALFLVTNNCIKPQYQQRVPVPVAMWKPWSNEGTQSNLDITQDPTIRMYDNKKAGVLICYEQLIMPTYLHTFAYNPKMLIATSNLWWAKETSIVEIQKEKVQLWALLFNVPYAFAYNE